jgi:hypothetical protein
MSTKIGPVCRRPAGIHIRFRVSHAKWGPFKRYRICRDCGWRDPILESAR